VYIASDEERKAFRLLKNEEDRERFVEQFWLRRDPTPDTVANEVKEEHYRRILYANEHYGVRFAGGKTDRGRIYIMYGPPDEIEAHPSGGPASALPYEHWRYRYIEGVGANVVIEFVYSMRFGNYLMTIEPNKEGRYDPDAALTMAAQMGLSDGKAPPPPERRNEVQNEEFGVLRKSPAVKFKDLELWDTDSTSFKVLPMPVRVSYVRVTNATTMANITMQFDNIQRASIRMLGRVTPMNGRPLDTFEREIDQATI
jgi:GWxTD domain-containing protein